MIIPPLCQTCGQPVGHLWETYVQLVQKYASEIGQTSPTEEITGRGLQIGQGRENDEKESSQEGEKGDSERSEKRGRGRPSKKKETKSQPVSRGGVGGQIPSPEYRALAELAKNHGFNPERYCCRFMFLCNHDISNIIH